ncbi:MAG TPA: ATP-binding protein [Chitinophagaceae bacterium]|nr:ATP-binding protein [Chitinophagaceae bacterium]
MSASSLNNSRVPKSYLLLAAALLLLLSFVSSIYFRTQPSVAVERKLLQKFIQRQQKDFEKVIKDSVLMRKLVQQTESLEDFKKVEEKDYGIFLYAETLSEKNQILFWNNHNVLPPDSCFNLPDGEYFPQLANGRYVIQKKTIRLSGLSNNVVAFAIIPVELKYEVETEFFYEHFAHNSDADKKIKIANVTTDNPVKAVSGKVLFHLEAKVHTPLPANDTVTVVLRLAAFLLFLVYIHFISEYITRKKGVLKGILFLAFMLVAVRAAIYFLPNVFYFRQFTLFDPTIYAAFGINKSLGDLLISVVLFCWLVVFSWYHVGYSKRLPSILFGKTLLAVGIVASILLVLLTFESARIIRGLVLNSKISFYVTDFFSLDIYTLIGFVILALMCLTFYYLSRFLLQLISPAFKGKNVIIYLVLSLIGLVLLTTGYSSNMVLYLIPVLIWLIIYVIILTQQRLLINRFKVTVAGILFWIFIFSISLAIVILYQNKQRELGIRKGLAEKFHRITDPSSATSLSIRLNYINNRYLLNNYSRFEDVEENRFITDSIIQENYSEGLVNNFNTKIYLFDSAKNGVNNRDPMSSAELNNILSYNSKPTETPDLFYHETSFDQFVYIAKRTIYNDKNEVGSFFMVAAPKPYNEDAMYPKLLRKQNRKAAENSPIYSIAVYDSSKLITPVLKYAFKTYLVPEDIPKLEYEEKVNGEYQELWFRANANKVIVVAKKQDTLIESITLFSYLFCAFLFLITLIRIIILLLRAGTDRAFFQNLLQVNIRSQVHNTIIFISVVSFLIIGAATISFFITRYNRNNVDKLSRTSGIMVKEMQKRTANLASFDNMLQSNDTTNNYSLQKIIDEVADIHQVDVNVYDLKGDLKVSSETVVYGSGMLSKKMHPKAFYHLNRLRQVQHVQDETMSSLKYLSIYSAVRNDRGDVYAYLNIPYFYSQVDLNQEISNFLVTIINLNAFIFLISGVIALFITNRITRSFTVIGDKMKDITLGKTNEEIEWRRNDEIGVLVKYYNKMVHQLEQSADALAKSEREGAWREMARQVAHEIKNPLTPMKLSIQYLQKAIVNNQPNVKELTANVATTLVEQIDHLSRIAADFARFANIGNRNNEVFDLHPVIESLYALYSANPKVDMQWQQIEDDIIINADKTQMNRLFSNLLSNAIDACADQDKCRIWIVEERREDDVIIRIIDNGEGIPLEMQPKIFTPNFTTKTSGTGLGLAMCKSIVEQAGGSIWFTTEPGKGTTFFVSLPIAD